MSIASKLIKPVTLVLWAVAAGAASSLAATPIAGADPILPTAGNGSAADAIQQLKAAGFDVSINYLQGHPNVPLNECRVQSISGLPGNTTSTDVTMMLLDPSEFDEVTLDVTCPNAK